MFATGFQPTHFALTGTRAFDSGTVVLTYTRAAAQD